MKIPSLLLTAAAVTLAAGTASAGPSRELNDFLVQAQSRAEASVSAAGVDLSARSVSVKAYVAPEGRLGSVHVVGSTGSRDADYAVEQAIRKVRLDNVPPALVGANLTLALGHETLIEARAR